MARGAVTGSGSENEARGGVQSIDRAVAILRCFDAHHSALGISEIARMTGLSTSTTHRLLAAMTSNRLLAQAPDRRYRPGPLLVQLGRSGAVPAVVALVVLSLAAAALAARTFRWDTR